MTIDQLITFDMIVKKGSFKAAAEHLHKTQPSLSVAIRKLEDEFEMKLFDRDEYRPKLTAKGKVFLQWAQHCLKSFRDLEGIGHELGVQKIEPYLTIALDPLVHFEAIEGICRETLLGQHPTELTFRSEIMNRGVELLQAQEVDFAISSQSSENEEIESRFFDRVDMLPVIAKSLAKKLQALDAHHLQSVPQIIVHENIEAKSGVRGALGNSKKCFVTDHALKQRMILGGFGWGRLSRSEIEPELKRKNLILIKDAQIKNFTLNFHMMRLKQRPMGPVAHAVWQHFLKKSKV